VLKWQKRWPWGPKKNTNQTSKGDAAAEVGTVCIAIATPNGVISEEFSFGKNRERVIQKAVNKVFEMLYKSIA
jgi:nicotinamide-nucleotide amidase